MTLHAQDGFQDTFTTTAQAALEMGAALWARGLIDHQFKHYVRCASSTHALPPPLAWSRASSPRLPLSSQLRCAVSPIPACTSNLPPLSSRLLSPLSATPCLPPWDSRLLSLRTFLLRSAPRIGSTLLSVLLPFPSLTPKLPCVACSCVGRCDLTLCAWGRPGWTG